MNLEFNKNNPDETSSGFISPALANELGIMDRKYCIKQLAAEWFHKEINLALMSLNVDEENNDLRQTFSTLIQWVTGDYLARWHDPSMHAILIKEVETRPGVQRFVSGRLPLLPMMIPSLRREPFPDGSPWLDTLMDFHIFPITDQLLQPQMEPALIRSVRPNESYLRSFFYEHHWMLILLICIASYQFFGYDSRLISSLKK